MGYSEIQRFRQPWLWSILITVWISVIGTFGFVVNRQLVQDISNGNSSLNDSGLKASLILAIVLVTALIVLFAKAKLSTQIDKKFISYKFYPLHRSYRKIAWNTINKISRGNRYKLWIYTDDKKILVVLDTKITYQLINRAKKNGIETP